MKTCTVCGSHNLNEREVDSVGGHYPIWWCEDCGSLHLGSNSGGPINTWQPEKSMLHHQVLAFHKRFGQAIGEKPHTPADAVVRFRLSLIAEEFFELLEAALDPKDSRIGGAHAILKKHIDESRIGVDLPAFVDAMADLDYVVEGARITFGVDGAPIAAEVHAANMRKLSSYVAAKDAIHGMIVEPEIALPLAAMAAAVLEPVKRADGKILKPEGWKPPDIEGELKKQGLVE